MYDVSIMVEPPMPSDVSVNLDKVDEGDVVDIMVTYVVKEKIGCLGTITSLLDCRQTGVPLIERAIVSEDSTTMSFGDDVLAKAPSSSSDRARTSYVVLEYKFKSADTMITDHNPTATTPTTMLISAHLNTRLTLIFRLLAAWSRVTRLPLPLTT